MRVRSCIIIHERERERGELGGYKEGRKEGRKVREKKDVRWLLLFHLGLYATMPLCRSTSLALSVCVGTGMVFRVSTRPTAWNQRLSPVRESDANIPPRLG